MAKRPGERSGKGQDIRNNRPRLPEAAENRKKKTPAEMPADAVLQKRSAYGGTVCFSCAHLRAGAGVKRMKAPKNYPARDVRRFLLRDAEKVVKK